MLLDGAHDREWLVNHLVSLVSDGSFNLTIDGSPVTDSKQTRQLMEQELDYTLRRLAGMGLLTDAA